VVGCRIIYDTDSGKIVQQLRRATKMKSVAVSKQYTRKPVHTGPVQILADHSRVSPLVPAIEQPVLPRAFQQTNLPMRMDVRKHL